VGHLISKRRDQDTVPEVLIQDKLDSWGYTYEKHVRSLPGSPDLVFPDEKVAIFVHGCFWHQHINCSNGLNALKLSVSKRVGMASAALRDVRNCNELAKAGWLVLVLWECQINLSASDEAERIVEVVCQIRRSR
jgi:DNA mismatch endonuclease (patch repair protein)